MLEAILFYVLAAVLVGLALVVITRTNPIASALAMVGAFGALAAIYGTLTASLVAITQILVYAGGIMVLMVFVIMLLNLHADDLRPMAARGFGVTLALLAVFGGILGPILLLVLPKGPWIWASLPEGFGDIPHVGEKIFYDYLFPFEVLSLLLLTAVVGALVLSKRKL